MRNPFGSIAKKEMIFISVFLILLIVMVVSDTSVDILVNYDEDMLYVTSPRLNIDIENRHVVSVELIDMPEFGTALGDSYEHDAYNAGTWKNDTWGDYTLCVIPNNAKCIVVELTDDRFVVFSCTTDDKTLALFESYHTDLN